MWQPAESHFDFGETLTDGRIKNFVSIGVNGSSSGAGTTIIIIGHSLKSAFSVLKPAQAYREPRVRHHAMLSCYILECIDIESKERVARAQNFHFRLVGRKAGCHVYDVREEIETRQGPG